MDFIFMLTRDDRTIEDCLDLMELIRPVGLRHVGFKDVGVSPDVLKSLTKAIHASGATSYMEVVSTTPEACLASARVARDLGVDRLLGGTQVDEIMGLLEGSGTEYYPFPGRPFGHPTKLGGTPSEVQAQCQAFVAKGCAGCDILAYRATEADPIDLVKAARRGLGADKYLIVAGAVDFGRAHQGSRSRRRRCVHDRHRGVQRLLLADQGFHRLAASGCPRRLRDGLTMPVIGIDLGTQSLKAVVVDSDLVLRGEASVPYQPNFPAPGWAEQDPGLWLRALKTGHLARARCRRCCARGHQGHRGRRPARRLRPG